jgi:hypothetical protein
VFFVDDFLISDNVYYLFQFQFDPDRTGAFMPRNHFDFSAFRGVHDPFDRDG